MAADLENLDDALPDRFALERLMDGFGAYVDGLAAVEVLDSLLEGGDVGHYVVRSTSSRIDHGLSVTPAAIAGVTLIVWWILTKL